MRKICLSLIMLSVFCKVFAQETNEWKPPTQESRDYHEYRLRMSIPVYNLSKIQDLTKILEREDDSLGMVTIFALGQKTYLSLSLREKFTYNMIHRESYRQNCFSEPELQDEQKKIFGQLPDGFGVYNWSEHQTRFFLANKDSVTTLMEDCIARDKMVGLNFKHVIVDINAKEMIPLLINTYNANKKDHDILTVLMLLMKDGEYDKFLISPSYKKLYIGKNYETMYEAYLDFSSENEALIIRFATDFYNTLPK